MVCLGPAQCETVSTLSADCAVAEKASAAVAVIKTVCNEFFINFSKGWAGIVGIQPNLPVRYIGATIDRIIVEFLSGIALALGPIRRRILIERPDFGDSAQARDENKTI